MDTGGGFFFSFRLWIHPVTGDQMCLIFKPVIVLICHCNVSCLKTCSDVVYLQPSLFSRTHVEFPHVKYEEHHHDVVSEANWLHLTLNKQVNIQQVMWGALRRALCVCVCVLPALSQEVLLGRGAQGLEEGEEVQRGETPTTRARGKAGEEKPDLHLLTERDRDEQHHRPLLCVSVCVCLCWPITNSRQSLV